MQNNIMYYRKNNNIECIYYKNSIQSYPTHTHTNHVIFGYILEGEVCIICDGEECLYHAGEYFCILPDTPHAVEPINDSIYSMVSICAFVDEMSDKSYIFN